jgi:hypothetical protein
MNDIFPIIFFGSLAILIVGAILKRAGVFYKIVSRIAAQWCRDGKQDQAANTLNGALMAGLITREQSDQVRDSLGIAYPEAEARPYTPPALTQRQVELASHNAIKINAMPFNERRGILIRLITENMGLLAECNQHRMIAGYKPREVFK